MHIHMMKSKLHRATITQAELSYEGSLTVDKSLMEDAGMKPNEMVKVYNINNGARFETYVIPGPAKSGVFCLNGAAARMGQPGDKIIVVTSCWLNEKEAAAHEPVVVLLDDDNKPKRGEAKTVKKACAA